MSEERLAEILRARDVADILDLVTEIRRLTAEVEMLKADLVIAGRPAEIVTERLREERE